MLVTDSKRNHENTIGHAGLALCAGMARVCGLDTWARTSAADHGARDPSHPGRPHAPGKNKLRSCLRVLLNEGDETKLLHDHTDS